MIFLTETSIISLIPLDDERLSLKGTSSLYLTIPTIAKKVM